MQQPVSTKCLAGEAVRITASANPADPITWQWHHDGGLLPGAEITSLTITGSSAQAGLWQAVIRSYAGESWSSPARLGVVWPVPVPGGVDGGFVPQFPFRCRFHAVTQHNGRLLAAGEIVDAVSDGFLSGCLVSLSENGNADTSFTATPNGLVRTIAIMPNGGLVVAGDFTLWAGKPRSRLAFLSANGELLEPQSGSNSPSAEGAVHCLLPLADGRLIIGVRSRR